MAFPGHGPALRNRLSRRAFLMGTKREVPMGPRQATFIRTVGAAGLPLMVCAFVQAPRCDVQPAPAASHDPEAQAIEASRFSGAENPDAQHRLLIKVET